MPPENKALTTAANNWWRLPITTNLLRSMLAHVRQESPWECCGVLIGTEHEPTEIIRLINEHAAGDRFLIETSLPTVQRRLRETGKRLWAVYHSHPTTPAWPSQLDLAGNAFGSVLQIIISLTTDPPTVRAFRYFDQRIELVSIDVQELVGVHDDVTEVGQGNAKRVQLGGVGGG